MADGLYMRAPGDRCLFDPALAGLYSIRMEEANCLIEEWGHRLGAVHRPFRQEAYGFYLDAKPIAIATSGSIVSSTVAGFKRDNVVELTRLGRHPDYPWVLRVMLRLWREICAHMWKSWPVIAAVSYHKEAWHKGDIYRFDGWKKVKTGCGSRGGGSWTRKRYASDETYGPKTLWIYEYSAVGPGRPMRDRDPAHAGGRRPR